ncbi:MAG: PD-(D/E)XK nuclease family protein [Actinomycetota bacterium]
MDLPQVDLTDAQRRTLERLIGTGERPAYEDDLAEHLRGRMEAAIGERTTPGGVWIGKRRLTEFGQCEGLLAADLLEEMPPFEHDERSAIGAVVHRAIQADIEVGAVDREDAPEAVCALAVEKLLADASKRSFAEFWTAADEASRERVLGEASGLLARFRATFPPLRAYRSALTPSAEFRVKADLREGVVSMSGYVDLAIGRPEKGRATRLLVDHKTGAAHQEQVEEMRYYALVHTLQHAVPPYRIASFFVGSGEWQAEDVSYEVLEHAADRVAATARRAIDLLEGDGAGPLNPGPWCGWCPRADGCPARAAADTA